MSGAEKRVWAMIIRIKHAVSCTELLRCSLNGFGNLIHISGVVPNKLYGIGAPIQSGLRMSIEWFGGLTDV